MFPCTIHKGNTLLLEVALSLFYCSGKKRSYGLLYKSHPTYTGYYFIQSNSINKLSNEIIRWIDNRNPGVTAHKVSEKFLYIEMLTDIGHAFANSKRTVTELKNTIINYLIEHQFKGIQNLIDLQVCMASYDYSEYPDNSG